jgi:ubiquinone/menaquinone biosynthesis C-methylase UbiE
MVELRVTKPPPGPDRTAALAQYRRRAGIYDLELALFEPIRERALQRLELRRGQTVLDVGCGTGLSFPGLRTGVGAGGRIVGIEQSPEMLAKARERVVEHGWKNVRLLQAPIAQSPLRGRADAALFHLTHDILRDPVALAHVVRHLKPGARVVASGLKWSRTWAFPVNFVVLAAARHSVTTLEGLEAPWDHLAALLGEMRIESAYAGGVFVAAGIVRRR